MGQVAGEVVVVGSSSTNTIADDVVVELDPQQQQQQQQEEASNNNNSNNNNPVLLLDIHPLNGYFFGSKDPLSFKPPTTLSDSLLRFKSNYQARGLRTCVQAVILVELYKHPHLLLLQLNNRTFNLPGGRLRQGESDVEGLRRKLSRKLSLDEGTDDEIPWDVGECLGMWWKPDFETLFYPYLPPNIKHPKECAKLFLVKLPVSRQFIVPKNLKLLAVPLCQVHDNHKTYGPIIAGIPQLLSKYSFNMHH